MSEQKRKKVLYAVLVLAVIWGIYNFPSKRSKGSGERSDTGTELLEETAPPVKTPPLTKMINIEQKSKEPWGDDPFRVQAQVVEVVSHTPGWHLSGIVFNSQAPLAIVNNRPVRIGDVVNNATVVSIKPKEVVLEHNGSLLTLTISKG